MRAIHEIARELTILNSIGYKTNYLLLWRYPIKRISITGQQNGSADRTVILYRLATFNVKSVRYKTLITFVSDFARVLTERSSYLAITPSTVNHAANQTIKCQ